MRTKFLRIGSEAIHYLHTGKTTLPDTPPPLDRGAAIVFVSGEGGSAAMWGAQLAHFGRDHSPVAIDLPAHGRSTRLDAPATVAEAVDVLVSVLVGLRAPPAVLVGHGYGGHVALAAAVAEPGRVRAVVTIGTSPVGRFPEDHRTKLELVVKGRLGQQFDTPYFGASPDMNAMRTYFMELAKTDPKVRLDDIAAYAGSDLGGSLERLSVPVLVVHGSDDRMCPCATADELARAIPGARSATIAGAGHVAHIEKPDDVNRAIESVLA